MPEVASRAHLEAMVPTIERACREAGVRLADLDAIAVTSGPGLAGALLVGVAAAKALAVSLGVPLYGVNAANPRNPNSPPRRVEWGAGSADEMAGLHIQVIPDRESDLAELGQALWGKVMRMVGGRFFERQ